LILGKGPRSSPTPTLLWKLSTPRTARQPRDRKSRSRVKREGIRYVSDLLQNTGLCDRRDLGGRATRQQAEEDPGGEKPGITLPLEHVMPREQQEVEGNH